MDVMICESLNKIKFLNLGGPTEALPVCEGLWASSRAIGHLQDTPHTTLFRFSWQVPFSTCILVLCMYLPLPMDSKLLHGKNPFRWIFMFLTSPVFNRYSFIWWIKYKGGDRGKGDYEQRCRENQNIGKVEGRPLPHTHLRQGWRQHQTRTTIEPHFLPHDLENGSQSLGQNAHVIKTHKRE